MCRHYSRLVSILTVSIVCLAITQASSAVVKNVSGPLVLVSPAVTPCPIIYPEKGPAEFKRAAEQLAQYLSTISKQTFTAQPLSISARVTDVPKRSILVGEFFETTPPELGDEGFLLRVRNQRLEILGCERGALYGVYWFLEHYVGCKWWSYSEEDIPVKRTVAIPEGSVRQIPAFQMHDLYNNEAQNTNNDFVFKIHAKSALQFTGNHTLYPLLTPYAEKQPNFWPMDDTGVRKANKIHFNYLAEGIADALTDTLAQEVEGRNKDVKHYIYQAGMGDWYGGMDQSPESKKVYQEEAWKNPDGIEMPGYSATLLRMVNRSATDLAKKYPGIKVGTFAYMSLEAPPAKTVPAHNVYIWVPRLRHDTVLSIQECEQNRSFKNNIEQWCKIAPHRVFVWEYGANYQNFMMPFPCLRSMAANIKYYHRIGVRGILVQGNYVSTGGDLVVLKNYVWRKLLWEPNLDVDALIRGFCKGYYGPAAEEMSEYINTIENSVRIPRQIHADEFDGDRKYLTPELVTALRRILERAQAKATGITNQRFYNRVREAGVGLEAFELWKPGVLEERANRLVRTDINSDKGGEYTFDRARQLTTYARGASAAEWGTGRPYHMRFLVWHGGPLFRLQQGRLSITVAPYQERRLWQIRYGDAVAVDGGLVSSTPASTYYEPVGAPTNTRIEMKSALGVGLWSPHDTQVAHEVVEIQEQSKIVISSTVERGPQWAEFPENQTTIEMQYKVGTEPASVTLEAQTQAGWRKIDLNADTRKAVLPPCSQLRITRADRGLVVLDTYSSPEVTSGEAIYDADTGFVKTRMMLAKVPVPAGKPIRHYEHVIEVFSSKP